MDNSARPRLQLRARSEDRRQSKQIAGLLLLDPIVQKRHAASTADDVAASSIAGGDATTWHDVDGTVKRTSQEFGRSYQEHATMHVRRR